MTAQPMQVQHQEGLLFAQRQRVQRDRGTPLAGDAVAVAEDAESAAGFSTGGEQRCVCVSGLPSPRDLEDDRRETERANATRNYQSLNDVAGSLVDLRCDYRIAFVIERVEADALKVRLGQVTTLEDLIAPFY
jgi:hypothetical protein